MKSVLFVYNPQAGKGTLRGKISDVLEVFRRKDMVVTVFPTVGAGDAYQLIKQHGAEFDRVICAGGDGTLHEAVHGLMEIPKEKRPGCGYIPTGTVNDFANGIKLPKRVISAAEVAAGDRCHAYDVGEMNGQYFSYVAAFGAFTEVSYSTPQETKNPERFRLPVFGAKKKLSGRARGSATHLFMQFADYNACRTADGIEQELERLMREKFLTPEQAQSVEKVRIERLFAAPFGARILQAEKLHREFKFSLLTDAVEFAPAAAGEQVMLQGVVDCFWEEADGIVLVDFKTDRTPDGPQACAARYCAQLNAYAKALTRIYGAPVKEKILYFFSCDCAYHLD